MRRPGLLFALALAFAGPAHAQGVYDLPLTGRVMDRADVLSDATERDLDARLAAHEAATTNQVVVLTIPSLQGEPVEQVANSLFMRWGLGEAARDNGVLLLVARDDRALRIEVGYGLEADLTDAEAGRIIRHVLVPAFRGGDFDAGVSAGTTAILGTIEGTYAPPAGEADEDMPPWFGLIFLVTHGLLPLGLALRGLAFPPAQRYSMFAFTLIFTVFGLGILPVMLFGLAAIPYGLGLLALYVAGFFAVDVYMGRSAKWREVRRKVRDAVEVKRQTRVDAGWISFTAGGSSSGSDGGYSGGGGFSGGGGSSGGGGASGSW